MMARIFRPAPNAMQSGRGNSKKWVLVYERTSPQEIEPLMGYTASADTPTQVRLEFDTLEAAEAFAQREGIAYIVQPSFGRVPKRSVYADNFRSGRKQPWTH